jgi:hypothetical protein
MLSARDMGDQAADPDRVARLRLLASSIAGRMVDVRAGAPADAAWTDGRTVFVDPELGARERLQCAVVQAALIAGGSLEPDVVRKLVGRPALARRYLAVEAHRALVEIEDRLPPSVTSLIAHRVGGSVASPRESLVVATSESGKPELAAVYGEIRPRAVLTATTTSHGQQADAEVDTRRTKHSTASVDDATEDGNDDRSALDWLSDLSGRGGALGRLLQRMLRFQRETGAGPLGADVPQRGRVVPGRTHNGRGRGPAARTDGESSEQEQRAWTYPEWDVRRRAYRANWCTVSEETPPLGVESAKVAFDGGLRRPLARLGLGLEFSHRRMQGEDLDIDAVIEARVEMRARVQVDEAVHLESLRRRHELAVLVLLDVSGSANEPSAAGGSVHDQQLAGAGALVQALYRLGNRVAVYGFYSRGRSAVRVVRVKRFDEVLTARVRRRFGALTPGGYTRFGAVIRHGAEILDQEGGGSRRLLIVLSDGFAYDHGYEGRYGEADARRALAEARRRGIGCLCLSLGAATDLTALRRVFGTAAHGTVRRPDELAHIIGPLLRDALLSAELERGTAQRGGATSRRSDATRRSA